ncbi:hypothetical protein ACFO3D_15380 [Virgibacillus kekensis]|uniref:DUF2524 family protein n=1 Tax=Virgibacillus kekensis TaxID=202261 RepID=A0ABV9DP19_9BACI
MHSSKDDIESVREYLDNARLAIERAQADQNGRTDAQKQMKLAEEILSEAKRNPAINNEGNAHELQRAADLLRLLEETNQAINRH